MWPLLAARHPSAPALTDTHHSPPVKALTYAELAELIDTLRRGLAALGVTPGDRVALFAESSVRWVIADAAIQAVGAVGAVRGAKGPPEELRFIVDMTGATLLVTDTAAALDRLWPAGAPPPPPLSFVVILWGPPPADMTRYRFPVLTFDDVLARGRATPNGGPRHAVAPTDVSTLVFTSGTTGRPKAAELTHANFLYQLAAFDGIITAPPGAGLTTLALLPPWHAYERTTLYYILAHGMHDTLSSATAFRGDLEASVNAGTPPDYVVVVPLVLEALYRRVGATLAAAGAVRRHVGSLLVAASVAHVRASRVGAASAIEFARRGPTLLQRLWAAVVALALAPLRALADVLVFSQVRRRLGFKTAICGGGSLGPHLDDWFEAAGVTVLNGYGLTETSPVLACRTPGCNVRGTVGRPLSDTTLKVVDPVTRAPLPDGETGLILAKGPGVMRGYYGDAVATAAAIDGDGYFDTGDLGWVAPARAGPRLAGVLTLVGRVKETIVLSTGEKVEPQLLENLLLESPLISQAMLVGERRLGALIVPDAEALSRAAQCPRGAVPPETARQLIGRAVTGALKGRPALEQVRDCFELVESPWSVEGGELTQTLKIKRDVVATRHADAIARLFKRMGELKAKR